MLLMVKNTAEVDDADRYPYLQAVLKSVGGYQVFRRYHADGMSEEPIIEFLLMQGSFPRSVQYALLSLEKHLKGLDLQDKSLRSAQGKVVRQAGKMTAELACLEREDLQAEREGQVLRALLNGCGQLGTTFADAFFRLGEVSA